MATVVIKGTIGIIPLELIEKSDDLELGSVHGIPGEAVVDYVGGDYDIAFFNTDGKQETSFNICTITCDEDYDEEEP